MLRRELFGLVRKSLHGETSAYPVRPPYGLDESLFQSGCSSCEEKGCVSSCDEQIIVLDREGIPVLDFSRSGCTFCDACAEACPSDVLSLEHPNSQASVDAQFRISTETCVAHDGVICFACKEPCIEDAILFNGMFNPVIDTERCTGCGFCLSRCPTQAISYEGFMMQEEV